MSTSRSWLSGIRLYIAISVPLLAAQIWAWNYISFKDNPELFASRLHEAFGWTALIWLAAAMAIGPAYKLFAALPGKALMRDARRMIGVGGAVFATIHACVAFIVSFRAINPLELSPFYQRGFLLGAVSLLILLTLAVTSFDGAMRRLGAAWFTLHRLIYVAAVVAVWHALSIGVNATSIPSLLSIVTVSVILFILHLQVVLRQKQPISEVQVATLCAVGLAIIILSNYGLQLHLEQYSIRSGS